jgi:hypothetical protein
MGLYIGQNPAISAGNDVVASARARRARREAARRDEAVRARPREVPEPVRAGFGKNTLSPPAAALITLGANLERAREVVPTFEELRAELRAAREEAARREAASEARVAFEQAAGRQEGQPAGGAAEGEVAAAPGLSRAARAAYVPDQASAQEGTRPRAAGSAPEAGFSVDGAADSAPGLNLLA